MTGGALSTEIRSGQGLQAVLKNLTYGGLPGPGVGALRPAGGQPLNNGEPPALLIIHPSRPLLYI